MLGRLATISGAITDSGMGQPLSLVDSIADDHGSKLSVRDFASMVMNWVSIEDDHVIQEMEAEEAVERFENSFLNEISDNSEEEEQAEEVSEEEEEEVIKDNTQAETMLAHLQAYARRKKMPESHIHDMNQVAHNFRRFHNTRPTSQRSLPSFFGRKNTTLVGEMEVDGDEMEILFEK